MFSHEERVINEIYEISGYTEKAGTFDSEGFFGCGAAEETNDPWYGSGSYENDVTTFSQPK